MLPQIREMLVIFYNLRRYVAKGKIQNVSYGWFYLNYFVL